MGLFTKPEYKDYMMKFEVIKPDEVTEEAMGVEFVAYTNIDGEKIFCDALFSFPPYSKYTYEEYTQLIKKLLDYKDKEIKVRLKFKNNKAKNFKIDISSIAISYNDDRLNDLELLAWGLHNSWPIK